MVILKYIRRFVFYGGLTATFCIPAAYRLGYKKGVLDCSLNSINHNYSRVNVDVKDIFSSNSDAQNDNQTEQAKTKDKKPNPEKPTLEEIFAK